MCYVVLVLTPNLYNIPKGNLGICSNKKQNKASFIKSVKYILILKEYISCLYISRMHKEL